MLGGGIERYLQEIAAAYAGQVLLTAKDGFQKDGRGAVVIQVDPDSKDCNIIWRPLSGMKTRKLKRIALNYDPKIEDLIVILPTGRLEGRGWIYKIIPRQGPQ